MSLRNAWEIASERIIPSKYSKTLERESEETKMDFVEIPEFSDREDKVIDLDEEVQAEKDERRKVEKEAKEGYEEFMESVKIEKTETKTYSEAEQPEVTWAGNFLDYGGYARMNRSMAFGLSNMGVRLKIEIDKYLSHVNEATQKQLGNMTKIRVAKDTPKVFGCTVPTDMSHAGRKILYTMIETADHVHKDYAGKLNLFDEIWTPTNYGKKILKESNVYPHVEVMPLGVDPSRYKPSKQKTRVSSALKSFVFVSIFRWSWRKSPDVLLDAYLNEFSADDDVSLLMVSRAVEATEDRSNEIISADFEAIKSNVSKSEEDLPHVALYTNPIPERRMPDFYNCADAFVLISRGEGCGLPYLESGASGLPIIASNCSGQSDFLKEDNSYLIEPDSYEEVSITGHLPRLAKSCHFYNGQKFPEFGENAINNVGKTMRHVVDNYGEAQEKAKKFRNQILDNFTWDKSVERVYNRLFG